MDPSSVQPGEPGAPDDPELQDLECAVCFSQFNNVFNTPKMLECGHTFCLECLARMNVKSSQPESLQCPLCRAFTPLPSLGLPKLSTDAAVLSRLPDAMQNVYSIRFNRNKGRLQLKRPPSALSAQHQPRSLDVGTPEDAAASNTGGAEHAGSFISRLLRLRPFRALTLIAAVLIVLSVAVVTIVFLVKK